MTLASPYAEKKAELPEELHGFPKADILLPYQKRAISTIWKTKLLFIEKSRRIGLTWGVAAEAALTAASSKKAGGTNFLYMGYTKEMAREFIDVVAMWAKAYGYAAGEVGEEIWSDPDNPDASCTIFRITFASGFYVLALPSVPRVLRGKQGVLFIDEAAFHTDLEAVLKAGLAFIMWGGRVVVVSTHLGIDNAFNLMLDKIKAGKQKGLHLKITFDEAIAEGLYDRVLLVGATDLSKEDYVADVRAFYGDNAEEELDCIPSQGSGAWINPEHLSGCQHADCGRPDLYQNNIAFHGYDVARRRDGIIQWTFEEIDGILWLREKWERVNVTFKEQREHFGYVMRNYRIGGAGVDQTGMGEPQVELLQDEFGTSLVQGFILSGDRRLALAWFLRRRFEAGTIRIDCSPETRADLLALKRAGEDGAALIEGKKHPDRFWAAAIACAVAAGVRIEYGWTGASSLRQGTNDDDDFRNRHGGMTSDEGETQHGLRRGGGAW